MKQSILAVTPDPAAQRFTARRHRFVAFATVQRSVREASQAARRRFLRALDQGDLRRRPRSILQCFARWVLVVIKETNALRERILLEQWFDEQEAAREGYELRENGPGDEEAAGEEVEPVYEPDGLELAWAMEGASL